jgi:hypothetical protein
MLTWTLLVLAQTGGELTPQSLYAGQIQEAATTTATTFLKASAAALPNGPAATLLEVEILPDGSVSSLRLAASSGQNRLDDLARSWMLAAEPLPAADAAVFGERGSVACLVRLGLSKKKSEALAACFQADDVLPFFAPNTTVADGGDPGALLFSGFLHERAGELPRAAELYKKAVRGAPSCDLAARALGLALVKQKKAPQAIPYLKTYVTARLKAKDALSYAREIERFEAEQKKRAEEFTRPRPRLGQEELMLGIKKGYPLLEPCLAKARDKGLLAVGTDTLLLSWKVKKDGSVEVAHVDGPDRLSMREEAECLERALLAWRFPPYTEGSEIMARNVPIKVRGARPPKPTVVAASTTSADASEDDIAEPTFSTCERPPEELGEFIRMRSARLNACLQAEKKRVGAGVTAWPDSLPVGFVIDSQGPVRSIQLGHRFFRDGAVASCITQALSAMLSPSGGADCPADFAIDLRALVH